MGMRHSRTPAIVADAAYVILTSKASMTTDNFFIDDEVLISNGLTLGDLDTLYKPKDVQNHELIADFMV